MDGNMSKFGAYIVYIILLLLLAAEIAGCSNQSQLDQSDKPQSLSKKVGWLHGKCIAIRNTDIAKGTNLLIVRLGDKVDVIEAKILHKTESEIDCYAMMADRKSVNLASGAIFYVVSSPQALETGIGVLDDNKESPVWDLIIESKKNIVSLRKFTQCATSEGLQFNVWNGSPYKSKAVWTGYYYVGYDIEANCPE